MRGNMNQDEMFKLEPHIERRVKECNRGAVPWYARYERRNRPHDYSTSKAKQPDRSCPEPHQRE